MKLYDLPEGSKIKEDCFDETGKIGDTIIFHHIDGMYSYCTIQGTDKVIHLNATIELEQVGDYFLIKH